MNTRAAWLTSLEALIGVQRCETALAHLQEYAVDGLMPQAVVRPESIEQVATVLQWAEGQRLAVIPYGSGTHIGLGGIPKRVDLVVSLRRLAQVNDYDVANFTITAGAGTTFAALAQVLAAQRQMLPVQFATSLATLGGLIAANAYSPKRLRYGGIRDLLLGLRIVLPSGEIAHFGGKVVKNVAGYDMCKLFLGSLGALGIIVEATFRSYALPERDETLLAVFPSLALGTAAVTQLMATQLLPSQVLLLDSSATAAVAADLATPLDEATTLLLVNCDGMAEAVERQLADLTRICRGYSASTIQVHAGQGQEQLRARLEGMMRAGEVSRPRPAPQHSSPAIRTGTELVFRLGTLPSRVPSVIAMAAQALRPLVPGAMIIGDCGVGLVKLCIGREGLSTRSVCTELARALADLAGFVAGHGGVAVVESAPPEVKAQLQVWGPLPQSFALLADLKRTFDPEGVLSPGRFIGGL